MLAGRPKLRNLEGAAKSMDRRAWDWVTYISELPLPGGDGYSVEIGYVVNGHQDLYMRLWRGDEFLCGAWQTDFEKRADHHIDKLPESLTQRCVECAERIKKLAVFI